MHWLKIALVLELALAAMRLCSWAVGWVLSRVARARPGISAALSNAAGFFIFVLLLWRDLQPGEPADVSAIVFGLAVFAAYAGIDLRWTPWKRVRRAVSA